MKVFGDLKTNTKKKSRKLKCDLIKTGGGPNSGIILNELEQKIMDLINPVVIDGLNIIEGGIDVNFDKEENLEENLLIGKYH